MRVLSVAPRSCTSACGRRRVSSSRWTRSPSYPSSAGRTSQWSSRCVRVCVCVCRCPLLWWVGRGHDLRIGSVLLPPSLPANWSVDELCCIWAILRSLHSPPFPIPPRSHVHTRTHSALCLTACRIRCVCVALRLFFAGQVGAGVHQWHHGHAARALGQGTIQRLPVVRTPAPALEPEPHPHLRSIAGGATVRPHWGVQPSPCAECAPPMTCR